MFIKKILLLLFKLRYKINYNRFSHHINIDYINLKNKKDDKENIR